MQPCMHYRFRRAFLAQRPIMRSVCNGLTDCIVCTHVCLPGTRLFLQRGRGRQTTSNACGMWWCWWWCRCAAGREPRACGAGPKGTGKTFQTELSFKKMKVEPVVMSAGELESEVAGRPGYLVRRRYRLAADMSKSRGIMSAMLVNDLDATIGHHDVRIPHPPSFLLFAVAAPLLCPGRLLCVCVCARGGNATFMGTILTTPQPGT